VILMLLGGIVRVFGFLALFARPTQTISFRLPCCKTCRGRKLEVSEFDWDDYCLRAYCHDNFCKALAKHPQITDADGNAYGVRSNQMEE